RYDGYRQTGGAAPRGADRVVAPTRAVVRELEAEYGLPLGEGGLPRVIRNGVPGPPAVTAPDVSYPVVTVGRLWDEAKNVRAIVEAARGLEVEVAAIGAAELAEAGGAASAGVDVPPNVTLLGVLPLGVGRA